MLLFRCFSWLLLPYFEPLLDSIWDSSPRQLWETPSAHGYRQMKLYIILLIVSFAQPLILRQIMKELN